MTHETCSDGLDRTRRMTRRGRTPRSHRMTRWGRTSRRGRTPRARRAHRRGRTPSARWLLAGLLLGVLVLPGCAWLAPGADPVSPCACAWRDLDKRTRA